jgi:SAM-dependent methyltransferase
MSHPEQRSFCKWVKRKHPQYFTGTTVVDVGSLNVNGTNRYLFSEFINACRYVGIDIVSGKNVDIVGKAHEVLPQLGLAYHQHQSAFYRWHNEVAEIVPDVVCSTDKIEHEEWQASLGAMYDVLRPGGLLLITYRNISVEDFTSVLKPELFDEYYINFNKINSDLHAYAIKR